MNMVLPYHPHPMTYKKTKTIASLSLAAVLAIGVILVAGINSASAQEAKFAVQATVKSMQDQLPGHEGHQIAIVLPPKDDGNMYSGIVTYVASQPVEVVVLFHSFNASATGPDHSEPLNAPFKNGKVALGGATNAGASGRRFVVGERTNCKI